MSKTHVQKRIGVVGKTEWMQLVIIRNGSVTILDLVPAAWSGWNLRSMTVQGADDWGKMSADAILAFKRNDTGDRCVVACTADDLQWALDLETRAPGILASRKGVA